MVETNVHYPTDINLLFDAMRKVIVLVAQLCSLYGLNGWRQWFYNLKEIKKLFRKAQKLKHSTSKKTKKKESRRRKIQEAHQAYIDLSAHFLQRVNSTLDCFRQNYPGHEMKLLELERFAVHADRQILQIRRRVINGETIPHEEKVFSLFEEHTEWICKGKAGVPQELGLKVCVLEDQFGFVLHHQIMRRTTDEKIAAQMVQSAQDKFSSLTSCSFDKGFHSQGNQKKLPELLNQAILPKKGRLSAKDQLRENHPDFVQSRRQHSAVESAINALENHGLDRCPDHGIKGLERYVSLAVLGRNLQILGNLIQQKKFKITRKRRDLKVAA